MPNLWGDVPLTSPVFVCVPFTLPGALGIDNPLRADPHYDFSGRSTRSRIGTTHFPQLRQPFPQLGGATVPRYGWNLGLEEARFTRLQCASLLHGCQTGWLQLRPPYVPSINSHHDYGWQDGPMIPNKGLQTYTELCGMWGRVGFLEFQYAPRRCMPRMKMCRRRECDGNQGRPSRSLWNGTLCTYLHGQSLCQSALRSTGCMV